MRLLVPPPQRTAYFSRARSPGVVLRVSRTMAPVPSRASAQRRVCVATPESRLIRLSRVRSPTRMARVEPCRTARTSPRRTTSPSSRRGSTSTSGDPSRSVTARNTVDSSGMPATTPSSRATTWAVLRWVAGMVALVVTSAPGKPPRSSLRAVSTTAEATDSGKRCRAGSAHGVRQGRAGGRASSRSSAAGPAGVYDVVTSPPVPREARRWPRKRASSRSGKSARTWPLDQPGQQGTPLQVRSLRRAHPSRVLGRRDAATRPRRRRSLFGNHDPGPVRRLDHAAGDARTGTQMLWHAIRPVGQTGGPGRHRSGSAR